jgi:hypothetical protein
MHPASSLQQRDCVGPSPLRVVDCPLLRNVSGAQCAGLLDTDSHEQWRHRTDHNTRSITLDGVTLTDSLIRWSPNKWPSVCREIPVPADKMSWASNKPAQWILYSTPSVMNIFTCQKVVSTRFVYFHVLVSLRVKVHNLSEASTADNCVYRERTLRMCRIYSLRQNSLKSNLMNYLHFEGKVVPVLN